MNLPSFDQPPLFSDLHIPPVNTVVAGGGEKMWWTHLLFRPQRVWRGTTGRQRGERRTGLWLLMRVFHSDTTCLMHLLYQDLQKYTTTGDALWRVPALMMCVKATRRPLSALQKPWQRGIQRVGNLSEQTLKMTREPFMHSACNRLLSLIPWPRD